MRRGESYEAFVDKFKPKKTTDDCYTPEAVYDAVAGWVQEKYGVQREKMLRPFWPGGDYQAEEYPEGCAVVDNPPFSIITQIVRWFTGRGIPFFLFAPSLTLFSCGKDVCSIVCANSVTYANGAEVNTSFVTNMDGRRIVIEPELGRRLEEANNRSKAEMKTTKKVTKITMPAELVTAATLGKVAKRGVAFEVMPEECCFVRKLDAADGKGIFGGGFLLSGKATERKAAAERAAAERAAAERWELSQRERLLVEKLGGRRDARAGGAKGNGGAAMAVSVGEDVPGEAPGAGTDVPHPKRGEAEPCGREQSKSRRAEKRSAGYLPAGSERRIPWAVHRAEKAGRREGDSPSTGVDRTAEGAGIPGRGVPGI